VVVPRGEYLVKHVLNCGGCHTPQGGAFLSGSDCLFKNGTGCLSTPNLTNDDTGLKKYTDQQIKDAITQGIDPDDSNSYLFANMPYYQFANLTGDDADAIVAYLRTVPGVARTPQANTAPFDVQPSTPEWAAVNPDDLPAAATNASAENGKYFATLACVTCHTVEVNGASPRMIDALKAFQGGKVVNATVNGSSKAVQTSNLTPDATGIADWTVEQIVAAIKTDKDPSNVTICGMRALPNISDSDATDIATYLSGLTPVENPITQTCQ
jgi:mono/diheme cytochrome c family protein